MSSEKKQVQGVCLLVSGLSRKVASKNMFTNDYTSHWYWRQFFQEKWAILQYWYNLTPHPTLPSPHTPSLHPYPTSHPTPQPTPHPSPHPPHHTHLTTPTPTSHPTPPLNPHPTSHLTPHTPTPHPTPSLIPHHTSPHTPLPHIPPHPSPLTPHSYPTSHPHPCSRTISFLVSVPVLSVRRYSTRPSSSGMVLQRTTVAGMEVSR